MNKKPEVNPFEGWTTVGEAARMIGRKRSTVQRWVESGAIRVHLVGPSVRLVNIEEIVRYAADHPPRGAE